jgi:hypothetical protein
VTDTLPMMWLSHSFVLALAHSDPLRADLEKVVTTMKNDTKVSGDLFWALQAHNDEFGWQPITANVPDKEYSLRRRQSTQTFGRALAQ